MAIVPPRLLLVCALSGLAAGLAAGPVAAGPVAGQAPPAGAAGGGDFELVLVGTGIPLPNPARGTAATLVLAGDQAVLVDTGRNAVVGLAQAGVSDLGLVLFTHYHSDHIAGFGELLVARGIAGATEPLHVIGPPGGRRVVEGFLDAYALDESYRVAHHGEHWHRAGTRATVVEAKPGVVHEEGGLRVTLFEVDHDPVPAVGYRFDYGGRSVVVSGDTRKVPQMVEMARGADVLVHEAVDRQRIEQLLPMLERADPRRHAMTQDMLSHHTSTLELAQIARDAGVKKLVLTHLVPSIPPQEAAEEGFVRGMDAIFGGPIVVGRDGMRIAVE